MEYPHSSLDDTHRMFRQIAAQNVLRQRMNPCPSQMNPYGMIGMNPMMDSRELMSAGMSFQHMSTTDLLKLQMMASMTSHSPEHAMPFPKRNSMIIPQMMNVSNALPPKIPTTFYHDTAVPFRHLQQPLKQPSSSDFPRFTTLSTLPKRRYAPKALTKGTLKAPRRNDDRWVASLFELKKYKDEYGDCIVLRGYPDNPRLASWVAEQRKQYKLMKDGKQSSITPDRVSTLNDIGFTWNAQEAAWDNHLEDLKRFKAKEGHCTVPLSHSDYPKLGLWVKEQRRHYALIKQGKHSHMTEDRAKALDAIGFCWDTHEAVWGDRLRELCNFKAEHGHCSVPMNYPRNPKLASWVHHQRRQYKKMNEGKECHITEDRIRALESIGFTWNPREKASSYERPENKH